MPDCDYCQFLCNLLTKTYITINISTLVLFCFLQINKFYEDGCFLQKIYYSELDPISTVYWSGLGDEIIKLGYLEEFSGKYTSISPKEIYFWKHIYITVKRNKNLIKDSNNYYELNYNRPKPVIIDVKVSFKSNLDYSYKRNSNICFSKDCLSKNGYCEIPFIYISLESEDSTEQFIKYNSIQISSKNSSEFYDPKKIYLYKIYREPDFNQKERQMDFLDTYKKVKKSILVINPTLRLTKILMLSFLTIDSYSKFCTIFNIFFAIFHGINALLFLLLNIYYRKLPDDDSTLDSIQVALVVLEFFCIILGIVTNYSAFSEGPECDIFCGCICCCCDDKDEQNMKERKKEKIKISRNLEKEIKDYKLEIDKNKENLENILFDIKK